MANVPGLVSSRLFGKYYKSESSSGYEVADILHQVGNCCSYDPSENREGL